MRKFLFEILVFSIILLCVLRLIKSSVPYYWGNELVAQKMEYLNESSFEYNSYFIGSSRTYRHINPIIFKEITGYAAFNLGASGTRALEVEYLIDNFISKQNSDSVKNIYVQKINYSAIQAKNLHSIRANYFLDSKRLFRGVKHFIGLKDYHQIYYHIISYIENQLCIGQIIKIFEFNFNDKEKLDDNIIEQNGFYSLNQDLENSNTKTLKRRNIKFNREIQERKQRLMNSNRLNIKKINWETIGINKYPLFLNLWHITGSPMTNPNFYFDRGHYNAKGAHEFTNQIANIVAQSENQDRVINQVKLNNIITDNIVELNYIDALTKELNLTALQKSAVQEVNEEYEKQKKLILKNNKNNISYQKQVVGINNLQTKKLVQLLGVDLYRKKRNFDNKWK